MSLQTQQIKLIDYRNACYQGYIKDNQFNKLGAVLTEDFLLCLAYWNNNMINGRCFTTFANQKMFFGNFQNNNVEGIVCYVQGKQCQIYGVYRENRRNRRLAAIFPIIQCVLQIQLNNSEQMDRQQQHDYRNLQQKWKIVQTILGFQIPDNMKRFDKFISSSFVTNSKNSQIEQVLGSQYSIKFRNQGIGARFGLDQQNLKQIGLYNGNDILQSVGKKIINQERKVREQGIYNRPQALIRYQQRPQTIKKVYRDHFRQGIDFQNKFIQLPAIQKIQKQFEKLINDMKDNTTKRIAQQLIQHLDQQTPSQIAERQKPKQNPKYDRGVMMADVSLDDLKQQLNRSLSHKKSRDKSPYREFQTNKKQPAQLKYTSRTPHTDRNQKSHKIPQKYTTEDYDTKYEHPSNDYISRKIDYEDAPSNSYKNRNFLDQLRQNSRQRQKQRQKQRLKQRQRYRQRFVERQKQLQRERQIRYPIQQGLRTLGKTNTSKSPIKMQQRPVKYKYTQQDFNVNPEKSYQYPKKETENYVNKSYRNANTRDIPSFDSEISNKRKYTPTKNQRLDKLSNMYDQIQAENNKPSQPRQNYSFNNGKGYQYTNNQQLDRSIGLVKTGRKVQSPVKKSVSPYKPERYVAQTESYERSYERPAQRIYQRKDYTDYTKKSERKPNYGYFDKNKL